MFARHLSTTLLLLAAATIALADGDRQSNEAMERTAVREEHRQKTEHKRHIAEHRHLAEGRGRLKKGGEKAEEAAKETEKGFGNDLAEEQVQADDDAAESDAQAQKSAK